jgi:hypothetical protein
MVLHIILDDMADVSRPVFWIVLGTEDVIKLFADAILLSSSFYGIVLCKDRD